jgi:3-oxoacyl-[acyl-carrier protein] reductase
VRLQDRVAIVTGAGQGIGRAASAMAELAGLGDAAFVRTDISDEASALACAAATIERFGKVDVLVNNAALYYDIDNQDNSYEYLQRVFQVNLHGAWLMARAVAPHMAEQRWGRIINQSSGAAYMYQVPGGGPFRELSAFSYSQTKWGVIGLTKFLAAQLGAYNVTVNCIAPGVTMTEATKKVVPEEFLPLVTMMTAMKRALEPEDITGTAVFFASDDASFVTGQVLCVDGGGSMPG